MLPPNEAVDQTLRGDEFEIRFDLHWHFGFLKQFNVFSRE